jgi:hypothetical protein
MWLSEAEKSAALLSVTSVARHVALPANGAVASTARDRGNKPVRAIRSRREPVMTDDGEKNWDADRLIVRVGDRGAVGGGDLLIVRVGDRERVGVFDLLIVRVGDRERVLSGGAVVAGQ